MRRGLSVAVIALAASAAPGCGGEEPDEEPSTGTGVGVVIEKATVAPGSAFKARVRNSSSAPVSYGLDYRLQREVDGEFTEVELPERVVIQIALVAEPGETGPPVEVEVPADAEPGRWRVILGPAGTGPPLIGEFSVE